MKTKHSLVSYLGNREIGNSLWSKKQSTWQHDAASVVAEEKATSPTKNMACELSGRSRSTFLITFSPNGQFIGSTHGDHAVRVTDVTSGKCLHVLKGHPRTPWSIAFHPISNNLLASGCLAGHVRIWDLHGGGSEVWKTPKNTVVTSLTFHPAGQVLLIATSNNILFWDWSQPQPFAQCATRNIYEKVRWVQFDTQGHFLYTGISNTTSVQGEETEETSTTECDPSVRRGDANQLRDRYQMIVEQITSMQRDGVLSGTVSDRHVMPRRQSDSQTNPRDDSQVEEPAATTTSDEVESDGDVEFHQSPDHSQSLEDATNYASLVTLATRAAMITRLGTSAGAPSMTRQSASASHGAADDVTSDTRLSWAPAEGVWSTLGAMSTSPPVQDPRSVSPRQRSVVWSEDARQSDSGEQCGGAGSGGARCSTSVPSAPLQCSDTGVSSSNAARVVASTNSPQTDFPQCTVQSRPAVGRNTHDVTSESTHTRRVSRMVLPPVLGNCAPSTTVESHFSPVHMSSSNTHSSDDTSAASVSDTSSENPQRESRQSVGLSSAQAISLGFNPHEGSTSTEQMPPSTSGESASMRTRPRLVVRVPRTNASTAAAADGGRSSSSSITTQSRSEHATTWRSLQERVSEDVEQDGATTEWSRRLHPVDVPATQQSRTADASSENQHRCTVLGESQRSVAFSSVQARTVGSNPQEGSTSTEQTPPSTSGESASMRTRPRLIVRVPRTIASTAAADGGRSSSSINSQLISESTVLQQRATTWWSRQERVSEEDGAGWPGLHRIDLSANQQSDAGEAAGANWSVHRRWSGALQQRVWTMRRELARRRQERRETHRRWHVAPRHHLHPHYSVSILDGSNRSNNGLQAAINRAIAGAFTARGEASVASNIDNLTHRIQRWDISSRFQMPDIDDSDINLVVSHCKMHNDTSCDISKDSTLLTTFVPSHQGFPDDTILGVFSLCPETLGQCMFTKSFGPNAISVSLSPLNNYVLVGLAARRLAWVFAQQMVGQVYRLKTAVAGEDSMQTSCDFQHVCDLMHPCDTDMQSHVSVNTACWMPDVGQGIAYATNKGDLHICTPGYDEGSEKTGGGGSSHEFNSVRQNLMQMLGLTVPRRMHYSALRHQRQTTGSQTDPSSDHSD